MHGARFAPPMPGKNVALRREVVDLLDREKRSHESYSDVVLRLADRSGALQALADNLEARTPVADDDLDRRLRAIRKDGRRGSLRRTPL